MSRQNLDTQITATIAGKDFSIAIKDLKAAGDITAYSGTELTLPKLQATDKLSLFSNSTVSLPALKKVSHVTVFGTENTELNVPDGAYIGLIDAYGSSRTEPAELELKGKAVIGEVKLSQTNSALYLVAPDVTDIAAMPSALFTFTNEAPTSFLSGVKSALRNDKIPTDVLNEDFADRDALRVREEENGALKKDPRAVEKLQGIFRKINDEFGTRAIQNYGKARVAADPDVAIDTVIHDFIEEQYKQVATGEQLIALNKKLNKIFAAISPDKPSYIMEMLGGLDAPNLIANAEFVEIAEEPRYALKNVGVTEDKPGIFSFKSFREPEATASSIVAQEPSTIDTLKANFLGLRGRVQLVDKFAAISEAFKKGMDAGKINALEASNGEYFLRFGENRSQYAQQVLTNGPLSRIVSRETKEGNEYIYKSEAGANLMRVFETLEGAGIKKDISLSNLRKTYLTWHHQVLGDDTGLVSSHSTTQVLEKYYLDPKVLTAVEISALKVRVFGKK
jgi:hypothetical protein